MATESPQPTDAYGFFRDAPASAVARAKKPSKNLESLWLSLLSSWPSSSRKLRHIKNLCRVGIPNSLRSQVWQKLLNVAKLKKDGQYLELLKKDPIPIYESIEKDIGRCYPDHQLFQKDGEGQRSLSNVLKAYAQYNPKVGYCQGMGMVAGMLLMYMPAEDTFWMLVALLNTSMRDVYDESLSQLRKDSAVFEYLLHRKFRKISKHLEKNEVTPIMYTAPWFMTLFTSSLPWETVLRFWDMFMCDGIKAEIRVGLAILELSQDKILSLKNTGDILAFLLHVPATLLPPDLVIETAVKIKLKRAKVAELRVKAGKNGVPERGELTLQ